jgi:hypothetical protein
MKKLVYQLPILFLACTFTPACSQEGTASIESWFDNQIGFENCGLLNGHEYLFPFRGANTHPFFFAEAGSKGWANYNGQWYRDIFLLYDLYSNQLILRHQSTEGQTKLMCFDAQYLSQFSLFGHHFTKINDHFYDILFAGNDWSFLVERKKITQVVLGRVEFEEQKFFYIQDKDALKEYKGKESLQAMSPDPGGLRNYLKQSKIKLGRKKEDDLVAVCSFIEKSRQQSK